MQEQATHFATTEVPPLHRIDEHLNERLKQGTRSVLLPSDDALPDPVFPRRPDAHEPSGLAYHLANGYRAVQRWVVPYMKARMHRGELRPILSYLFSEWKCNLDCHYCWSFNNQVKGMTEDTAKRSIDWLHDLGCRVIAIMGGEPLLRPKFIHRIVDYGAQKGFFVYLPTNGRLMKPGVIDRIGDAGVAAVNLAVDCVEEKPGLPKALNRIRPFFEHLVEAQRRYGYMVIFNMNICRHNMEDIRALTEIAYEHGISTDYHVNETPMIEQRHFKHYDVNSTYLHPEDYPLVDDLLDHLIDKHNQGYIMVNSKQHLADMKDFMRGKVKPWRCLAGQNTLVIRTDGTLAPCFPMYSASHDWGVVGDHRFEVAQLDEMKKSCTTHCLSTCQYTVGYYFNNRNVLWTIIKQLLHGHQGDNTAGLSQN